MREGIIFVAKWCIMASSGPLKTVLLEYSIIICKYWLSEQTPLCHCWWSEKLIQNTLYVKWNGMTYYQNGTGIFGQWSVRWWLRAWVNQIYYVSYFSGADHFCGYFLALSLVYRSVIVSRNDPLTVNWSLVIGRNMKFFLSNNWRVVILKKCCI